MQTLTISSNDAVTTTPAESITDFRMTNAKQSCCPEHSEYTDALNGCTGNHSLTLTFAHPTVDQ